MMVKKNANEPLYIKEGSTRSVIETDYDELKLSESRIGYERGAMKQG
jgi:hypothetical protein